MFEFNENDCTAPHTIRKRPRSKKKVQGKQMTMYDYASTVSYKHKQFYSSLDNSTTSKTIIKGQKRPLILKDSSFNPKKPKTMDYEALSPKPSPDFIDNLLQYLDKRSRTPPDEHF